MNNDFVKFPKTHYLERMGSRISREDKVLPYSDAQIFFCELVSVEEKVDGTNLGFSISNDGYILVQNRGNYISSVSHKQYKKLDLWVADHYHALKNILIKDYILYGEWCYAKHSIQYEYLPDWFLAFDIYDRKCGRFLSRKRRSSILEDTGISEVPTLISEKLILKDDLENLITLKSVLYNGPVEGIYLRIDGDDGYLSYRAKVVRPEFSQTIDKHWSKTNIVVNSLAKINS